MTLKAHWFQILLALAGGVSHGAEIRRRIRETAGEPMEIYPAMLYGSLEDLQELGHIEEVDEGGGRPPGQHERRRYYRITDRGRETLAQETLRLENLTRAARQALGLS